MQEGPAVPQFPPVAPGGWGGVPGAHLGQAGGEEHALEELPHALQELVHVRPLEHVDLGAGGEGGKQGARTPTLSPVGQALCWDPQGWAQPMCCRGQLRAQAVEGTQPVLQYLNRDPPAGTTCPSSLDSPPSHQTPHTPRTLHPLDPHSTAAAPSASRPPCTHDPPALNSPGPPQLGSGSQHPLLAPKGVRVGLYPPLGCPPSPDE